MTTTKRGRGRPAFPVGTRRVRKGGVEVVKTTTGWKPTGNKVTNTVDITTTTNMAKGAVTGGTFPTLK